MQWFRMATLTFVIPALAFLLTAAGCGKKEEGKVGGLSKPGGGPTGSTTGGAKTALEAKAFGVLKGKVTYDGDPPADDGKLKKQMEEHKDKEVCLAGDSAEFTWRVNPENKGVENVVIFVEPPTDKYFKPDEAAWKKEDVAVDQPHCAFEPHVLVAFPGYYDGKGIKETGQKVTIKNSAPIAHNTKYAGDTLKNAGGNITIQPKTENVIKLKPDAKTPISLNCDFHKFMKGYIWALDTPYYAVTDKDGNYEIKGVPAGTKVRLFTWHEGTNFFNEGAAAGQTIELKEGDNPMDFKVKKK